MKKFIIDMVSDSHTNSILSKRVIGTLGFLLIAISMLINSYIPYAKPIQAELISAIEFITIAALFGTTADRFSQIISTRQK